MSTSTSLPNHIRSSTFAEWPGKTDDSNIPIYVCEGDFDFVDVFELKLAQGRNFSRDFPSDVNGVFLINECAVEDFGWENPLGREMNRWGNEDTSRRVVGVLKDFHMHSLREEIKPMYIFLSPQNFRYISIKIAGENIQRTLSIIEDIHTKFSPTYPFEYSFFDDVFDRAYSAEQRIGRLFSIFALLTILIACLGLFGMASFTAESRTKEIGIRKVLGASETNIIRLLSLDYVKKIILATCIACPLGYYAMSRWLQNFAYRVRLDALPFFLAGILALAIALLTVSFQTFRAATTNPADTLRYE